MSVIEEIKTKLQKYPHAKYKGSGNSISVLPTSDDGFTVSLIVNRNTHTVLFDGWHEDFHDKDEALNCFAFGLSTDCRLKEYRRGRFVYKCVVEAKEDGRWVEDSETGLLVFPFWANEEFRYLQNNLISEERGEAKPDI